MSLLRLSPAKLMMRNEIESDILKNWSISSVPCKYFLYFQLK